MTMSRRIACEIRFFIYLPDVLCFLIEEDGDGIIGWAGWNKSKNKIFQKDIMVGDSDEH